MSERREIAERIAQFICASSLAEVYGGDVARYGRYYGVGFSQRRNLDGEVRVYGPKFVQVVFQCRYRYLPHEGSRVFACERDAIEFLRLAFVTFDAACLDVPVKPSSVQRTKSRRAHNR